MVRSGVTPPWVGRNERILEMMVLKNSEKTKKAVDPYETCGSYSDFDGHAVQYGGHGK